MVNSAGNVSPTGEFYDKSQVDAKISEINSDLGDLGALAREDEVTTPFIKDDAVTINKVESNIRTTLQMADDYLSGAPNTGKHVLSVDDGHAKWLQVVEAE